MCRYSWRAPDDFRGRFRIEVELDSGPFKVTQEDKWYSMEDLMK
ncbi:MAG: hypothetical protein ACYSU8_07145 [Planctomycetota bacterium]